MRERGAGRRWGSEGKKAQRHRGIEAEGEEMRDTERDRRERLAENGTKTGGERVREFREAESQERVCASSGNGEGERERERQSCQPGSLCPDQVIHQRASERLLFE